MVKRLADELETTVGYLLGETKQVNLLKNPAMLKRLNDIEALPDEDKHCILYAIDGLLRDAKAKHAYK